jgi:magnesium-transporting ATPase (P-type)
MPRNILIYSLFLIMFGVFFTGFMMLVLENRKPKHDRSFWRIVSGLFMALAPLQILLVVTIIVVYNSFLS